MARMVWVAVGAAGGIYAYKKLNTALDDARERGLVGNVNAAATTASAFVGSFRQLVAMADTKSAERGVRIQRRPAGAGAMHMDPVRPEPSIDLRSGGNTSRV